jgi:hypothetical protein
MRRGDVPKLELLRMEGRLAAMEPHALRVKLACLLWWDVPGAERSVVIGGLAASYDFAAPPAVEVEDVRRGLLRLGYSPVRAHVRSQFFN